MNTQKTGALLNKKDMRDIEYYGSVKAVLDTTPEKWITDISMIPVENQKNLGICVACAELGIKSYLTYKQTGKIVSFSERYLYKLGRIYSGMSDDNVEGTYPRDVALATTKSGCAERFVITENRDLPHREYLNFQITGEMVDSAVENKNEGFAFLPADEHAIRNAIVNEGVFGMTLAVGNWTMSPYVLPPEDRAIFFHRVWAYGYEKINGRLKIYFRNHWSDKWGNKGNGYLMLDEYKKHMYDLTVYTDIPDDAIELARKKTAKPEVNFDRDIKHGEQSETVRKLQECLIYEGLLGVGLATGYFGELTRLAVKDFQLRHGIASLMILVGLGGMNVGKATRAKLNELFKPTVGAYPEKIKEWAIAIQNHEGYFPAGQNRNFPNGTRSWRNKNPGNIRYVGQSRAIGKDSGGFCIFNTYEDGLAELCDMLIRCAKGESRSYPKGITLLQFFQIYAPSADNNNPVRYAAVVAQKLGVQVETKISELLF